MPGGLRKLKGFSFSLDSPVVGDARPKIDDPDEGGSTFAFCVGLRMEEDVEGNPKRNAEDTVDFVASVNTLAPLEFRPESLEAFLMPFPSDETANVTRFLVDAFSFSVEPLRKEKGGAGATPAVVAGMAMPAAGPPKVFPLLSVVLFNRVVLLAWVGPAKVNVGRAGGFALADRVDELGPPKLNTGREANTLSGDVPDSDIGAPDDPLDWFNVVGVGLGGEPGGFVLPFRAVGALNTNIFDACAALGALLEKPKSKVAGTLVMRAGASGSVAEGLAVPKVNELGTTEGLLFFAAPPEAPKSKFEAGVEFD